MRSKRKEPGCGNRSWVIGLNDEREKLRQAKLWLKDCDVSSQHFKAAWEHITWQLGHAKDPAVRDEALKIADTVTGKNKVD